jgi:hypothetical protein
VLAQMALGASFVNNAKDTTKKLIMLTQHYQNKALDASPKNPTYWKTAAKNSYVLYQIDLDPTYLRQTLEFYAKARKLSPTDPRIPYSQALMYSLIASEQDNQLDQARHYQNVALKAIDQAIILKGNYQEAYQLRLKLLQSFGHTTELEKAQLNYLKLYPNISTDEAQELGIQVK